MAPVPAFTPMFGGSQLQKDKDGFPIPTTGTQATPFSMPETMRIMGTADQSKKTFAPMFGDRSQPEMYQEMVDIASREAQENSRLAGQFLQTYLDKKTVLPPQNQQYPFSDSPQETQDLMKRLGVIDQQGRPFPSNY